jgi:hypothetical protein
MPEIDPEQIQSQALFYFSLTTLQQVEGSPERDILQGGQPYVHFLLDIYCRRSLTACRVRSRLDNLIYSAHEFNVIRTRYRRFLRLQKGLIPKVSFFVGIADSITALNVV